MAIDISAEPLLTFAQAAAIPPRRRLDRPVAATTPWRWHKFGAIVPGTGERVYLEAIRLPSGYATSLAAVQRFLDRLGQARRPR